MFLLQGWLLREFVGELRYHVAILVQTPGEGYNPFEDSYANDYISRFPSLSTRF